MKNKAPILTLIEILTVFLVVSLLYISSPQVTHAAAPTLNNYYTSTWNDDSSGSETCTSMAWSAGDVIVIVGGTEDDSSTLNDPTNANLTISSIASAGGADTDTRAYAWTATAASSQTAQTITATGTGGLASRGIACFVYSGSGGIGASATLTGSTAVTVISLTRGSANSAVVVVLTDWNAVSDTATTPTPTGTERHGDNSALHGPSWNAYVNDYSDQGAAGTTNYGITDFVGGGDMTGIVVEIKGTETASGRKIRLFAGFKLSILKAKLKLAQIDGAAAGGGSAPTVTTDPATSIDIAAGRLNGNITATGGSNATVRGFAWGTVSTLSGGDTATTSEPGSFGTGTFFECLTGLTNLTTYYFRAYATNPTGTGYGVINSFETNAGTACG